MTGARPDSMDRWAAGTAYDAFMGRWSRPLAREFLAALSLPRHAHWLELGCGTGALTEAILETQEPAAVVACEPAAPLLDHARQRIVHPLVAFRMAGAGELPRDEPLFDVAISSLVLNFVPDPRAAVKEMAALCRSGGHIAACVWDYAGEMEFLRLFWDAACGLDPSARVLDEGSRFPLCRQEALEALFQAAGLEEVSVGSVAIATVFESFEDYWLPLLGGTGPAPSYVASLTRARQADLADRLRTAMPADGALRARAWTVAGLVPDEGMRA